MPVLCVDRFYPFFCSESSVPHAIIQKLKQLELQTFAALPEDKPLMLSDAPEHLCDHSLTIIDDIIAAARRIFGTRCAPSVVQMRIMAEHGFEVLADNANRTLWKRGVIRSRKGLIRYW
jgi:hypothetical protein